MSVYVLRHGQTEWNRLGIVQGRSDTSLNEVGFAQAKEAKKELDKVDFARCYCSPLLRARQTMETVLEGRDIPIFIEPRLVEMAYGDFEGTKWQEGYHLQRRIIPCRHQNGESYFDMVQRIYPFLDEINEDAKTSDILLVCHGAVSRVIETYFRDDLDNDEFIDGIIPNGGFRVYKARKRPDIGIIKIQP